MKKIAIIGGTGEQGFGLALRWAKAGREIIIGSRNKEKAVRVAETLKEVLGPVNVEGMDNREAARNAQIIVLSVPFQALGSTMREITPSLKGGDILVSVVVPLAEKGPSTFLPPPEGSAAELVKSLAPESVFVVSAFQNVSARRLKDGETPVECDVVVSGDKNGKTDVMELAALIPGVRVVDGGEIDSSRIVESLTALLIRLNLSYRNKGTGIRFTYIKGMK